MENTDELATLRPRLAALAKTMETVADRAAAFRAHYNALRAENARLREALRIANDHLRVLYPNGLRDGDFVCVTVNTALARTEAENG